MSDATIVLHSALGQAEKDLRLVLDSRTILLPRYIDVPAILETVWPTIKNHIASMREELSGAGDSLDGKLKKFGLTGPELSMKLSAYQISGLRAREFMETIKDAPGFIRKAFKILLGFLNVWLGSLVDALGMGHAVKEFKEYLEQGVEAADIFD